MERVELLSALKRASPALAAKEDVPAFASFFFDGRWVRAYDDQIAISTRCALPIQGGLNGKVLMVWIGACTASDVDVEMGTDQVTLKSGRSKLDLPALKKEDFIFEEPAVEGAFLPGPLDLLEAMAACADYMGTDTSAPQRLGMTLRIQDGLAFVYSTNGGALGSAQAKVETEDSIEVLIPNRFVELLLSMSKTNALSALRLGDGWIEATMEDETTLFSRTLGDVNVKTFEDVLQSVNADVTQFIPVPDGFLAVVDRVSKVLAATKMEKAKLSLKGGSLTLTTFGESLLGALADTISCDEAHPSINVIFNPAMVMPRLVNATQMSVIARALVLKGVDFEVIVAASKD